MNIVWVVLRKTVGSPDHDIVAYFDNEATARRRVLHLVIEQGGGLVYYEAVAVNAPGIV